MHVALTGTHANGQRGDKTTIYAAKDFCSFYAFYEREMDKKNKERIKTEDGKKSAKI